MEMKLQRVFNKDLDEDARIQSAIYRFNMNVPRDIRYSVIKHDCFPKFQTNGQFYVKPLVEDMSLLNMYKNNGK